MVRVPPHPKVSVAASLWTLPCIARGTGARGAPLRSQGCGPIHHPSARSEAGLRITRPVKPPSRTATPSCCWMYNNRRLAPIIPRVIALTLPTNRARSRVASGVLPPLASRRAVRGASHKRGRGTEHVMVSVSQSKPKQVNCLQGRKEHLDVLRFSPTWLWSKCIATAIPRANVVRS